MTVSYRTFTNVYYTAKLRTMHNITNATSVY